MANQRVFGIQRIGKHAFKGFSAPVAVSVAGGCGKHCFADFIFDERFEHLFLVILGHVVDFLKHALHLFGCAGGKVLQAFAELKHNTPFILHPSR